MLAPTDKLKSGEKYTLEFTISSFFGTSCSDAETSRRLNLAFAFVENAIVSRPFFSERVAVTFTWRGPANTVRSAADSLALVMASCGEFVFQQARAGVISAEDVPCSERGPIDSITCGISEAVGTATRTVTIIAVLFLVAIVVVAFSPAGTEAIKKIPRVTSG